MNLHLLYLLGFLQTADGTTNSRDLNSLGQLTYGVDVSFPHHNSRVSTNYEWLPHNVDPANNPTPPEYEGMPIQPLGDKQSFYEKFLQGCREYYDDNPDACDVTEKDRVEMNLRQPQSMQNYTELGFKKLRAPKEVFDIIKKFWDDNHGQEITEPWYTGNTYTNHWEAPTLMLNVENVNLEGGGWELKDMIWDLARTTIEEWTGQELSQTSLYGIRKYTTGAVLATHVDRLPLVSSAIINVAQDVDEPWVLEVYAHDGKAYNITMEPGDMVLYESHSVLHGRPFPLKGRYYANVFIHFEPVGPLDYGSETSENFNETDSEFVSEENGEINNGLPPYVLEGSPEAENYRKLNDGKSWDSRNESEEEEGTGSNYAHYAASAGDVDALLEVIEYESEDVLHSHDNNGWLPIHEAARGGHVEVLQVLLDHGVDINERTAWGKGQSVLNLAYEFHDEDHPIFDFLLNLGAEDIDYEPDL